jgi:hypothetical protein
LQRVQKLVQLHFCQVRLPLLSDLTTALQLLLRFAYPSRPAAANGWRPLNKQHSAAVPAVSRWKACSRRCSGRLLCYVLAAGRPVLFNLCSSHAATSNPPSSHQTLRSRAVAAASTAHQPQPQLSSHRQPPLPSVQTHCRSCMLLLDT